MNFAVIGLGTFGRAVARSLAAAGAEVVAIDTDPEIIEAMKDEVAQSLRLNSTDERAMRGAGLEEVDVAVVAHGENLEASILTTVILRRMGVPRIVARSISDLHSEVLSEVGADRVVSVERELGRQLAESLLHPSIRDRVPLAQEISMVEMVPHKSLVGRSLRQLELRPRWRLNVVAVRRRSQEVGEGGEIKTREELSHIPDPDRPLESSDRLIVVGRDADLAAFGEGREPGDRS